MDIFRRILSFFLLFTVFLVSVITEVLAGSVIHGDCGKQVHTPLQGYIESPGYPDFYPNDTNCQWEIRGTPGSIISVRFEDFELDEVEDSSCETLSSDRSTCCSLSWLKINSLKDDSPLLLCGRNKIPKPYLSIQSSVRVKFHSSMSFQKHRGFRLLYAIIQLQVPDRPTSTCLGNETTCFPQSPTCVPRCDHVMHCSSGIDEMNCVKGCQGRIMCKSWNGCYTPSERCNGIAQCGDHSDEHDCSPELCQSDRGGFLCHNRQCIRESWQCDQTNDCGDSSDELNCLRNSVITAAVMGSLICGLLLVIAIGCTCKLYALRYSDGSGGNGSSTRPTLQLSPLEREILCREPPPPYSIAVSHPPGVAYFPPNQPPSLMDPLCLTRFCRGSHPRRTRRIRRQRRHPPSSGLPPSCLMAIPSSDSPGNVVFRENTSDCQPESDPNNFNRATDSDYFHSSIVANACNNTETNKHGVPAVVMDEISLISNVPQQGNSFHGSTVANEDVMQIEMRQEIVEVDDDDRPLLEDE